MRQDGFSCFLLPSEKSIATRLSKTLGDQKNRYFHAQYAVRLSDGKVASLDPLDTDIAGT